MKIKLKNLLHRIPRPVRACVCAALVILLAAAYYIALGCPTLTFRQEFRRAEKVHMVGPSKIVDTMNGEYDEFDKMIVGETEEGVCFFGRYYNHYPYGDPFAEKQYMFSYVEKTGDMTLTAAPNVWLSWSSLRQKESIPVYLFTEVTEAVRAQVEITVIETNEGQNNKKEPPKYTFQAEADRSDGGFFRFWLQGSDSKWVSALGHLSAVTGGHAFGVSREEFGSILATVRLYNAEDQLIRDEALTIYETAE